ncbi:MAG: sensor histidine kinase, partial [Saprospiraceae bacterium]|nr:sensor histidine kinase [Saprospiraceae bacterium]
MHSLKINVVLLVSISMCVLLMPVHPLEAQHDPLDELIRKGRRASYTDHDSALYYLQSAAELAAQTGTNRKLARVHELLSVHEFNQIAYQEGIMHLDTALRLLDTVADAEYYGHLLHLKGWYHRQLLNYDSAFHYLNQAIGQLQAVGSPHRIWSPYYYMGEVYTSIGDREKASEYYTRAIDATRPAGNTQDLRFLLYMVSYTYRLWNWDEEAANLQEEYLIQKQRSGVNILEDDVHVNLPGDDSDPALQKQDILRFLEHHEKNRNNMSLLDSYRKLGNLELQQGNHEQAGHYYNIALSYAKSANDPTLQFGLLDNIYKMQKRSGNLDQALAAHERMFALRDSIRDAEKIRQLQDLEVQYETTQKEQALAIKELELEKSRRSQVWTLLGLVAIGLIAILALVAVRTKQRSNRRLGEKNAIISQALREKDILLREIHHRVKNNLQMISALLYLQGKSIDDPTAQDAIKESQNRVQSMAMLHQNLYQDEDLLGVEIKDYLDKLFDHLFASYNIEKERIALRKQIEDVSLDVDTVVPLALIVNELISNALKHAFRDGRKGEIDVRLSEENDTLVLEVADNGTGLPVEFDATKSGNF